MNRRLIVMRHAKSSWKSGALFDHERPLNQRGKADAPVVAKRICDLDWKPDVVLSSDSQRTRETLELMLDAFGDDVDVSYLSSLYHAGFDELSDSLGQLPDSVDCVLALGHNPGWEESVSRLCGKSIAMTTANAALLEGQGDTWPDAIGGGGWLLRDIIRPKEL